MKNVRTNHLIILIQPKIWIYALWTVISLNSNFSNSLNPNINDFLFILNSFKSKQCINLLLFFIIGIFYKKTYYIYKTNFSQSERKYIYIPALLFSCFMVLGISFELDNSWQLIWGNGFKIIRDIIFFVGHFFLFSSIITIIFYYSDQLVKSNSFVLPPPTTILSKLFKQYYCFFHKKTFSTVFLTLFIAYIPYILLSYPGTFMGDTISQIVQCFNLKEGTSESLNLISENVRINNHHPIIHSLLIHMFIVVGKACFDSYNMGIFLYCFFQLMIFISIIATLIKIYVEHNINYYIIFFTIFYFIASPRIQNYMFLITKDVLFSVFLLLFVLFFQNNIDTLPKRVIFIISLFGIIFFRNDGKYIILLTACISGLMKNRLKKRMFFVFTGTLLLTAIYGQLILPFFQITPSSPKEMLSIPFQQTARYLRDAKDDVTIEEKQAISQVLDYDHLAEKYNPNLSDPVKATFNKLATPNDMKQYFRCWLQMFWKHPGIYLQATLNNKYRFFYPSSILSSPYSYSWSANSMEITNSLTADEIHTDFAYPPQLNIFRNTYEQFREAIFHLPVLSVLLSSATYTWLLILWTCYCLKCKNITSILYTTPLYVQLLICMAGPCNGEYFRYMYPIAVCLPVVITLGFDALQKKV